MEDTAMTCCVISVDILGIKTQTGFTKLVKRLYAQTVTAEKPELLLQLTYWRERDET